MKQLRGGFSLLELDVDVYKRQGHNLVFFIPNQQQGDTKDGSKQRANQRVPAFEEDCDAPVSYTHL